MSEPFDPLEYLSDPPQPRPLSTVVVELNPVGIGVSVQINSPAPAPAPARDDQGELSNMHKQMHAAMDELMNQRFVCDPLGTGVPKHITAWAEPQARNEILMHASETERIGLVDLWHDYKVIEARFIVFETAYLKLKTEVQQRAKTTAEETAARDADVAAAEHMRAAAAACRVANGVAVGGKDGNL